LLIPKHPVIAFRCISGGSRKTRIETQNESKDESKPKGISGGSRKTRIETGPGIGFE